MEISRELMIHTAMFDPNPQSEGGRMTMGLIRKLTGEPGQEIIEGITSRRFNRFNLPEDLALRANTYFWNYYSDVFGLGNLNAKMFWRGRQREANNVHYYIMGLLPNLGNRSGITTEVTTITGDITDTLGVLATEVGSGQDQVSPLYQHEMRRRFLLGLSTTELEIDDINHNLSAELGQIETVFAQDLFIGSQGKIEDFFIYAHHDPKTNQVLHLDHKNTLSPPRDEVIKRHDYKIRIVTNGIGRVFYDSREKPRSSAIVKALDRACRNGGFINLSEDVNDRFGVVFVLMNPRISPNYFSKMVGNILGKDYKPIVDSYRDDKTDGYSKGEEPKVKMHRMKYQFEGIPTEFEAMILKAKDHIDYMLHIGKKDPKTGIYNGGSRSIYEVERLRAALTLCYPNGEGFYGFEPGRTIADRVEEIIPVILSYGQFEEPRDIPLELLTGGGTLKDIIANGC